MFDAFRLVFLAAFVFFIFDPRATAAVFLAGDFFLADRLAAFTAFLFDFFAADAFFFVWEAFILTVDAFFFADRFLAAFFDLVEDVPPLALPFRELFLPLKISCQFSQNCCEPRECVMVTAYPRAAL